MEAQKQQKLIVITGASSGIGKCCAQIFGKIDNYKLLLLSRRIEPMLELNLVNALCLSCDILKYEQFSECVQKAEKQFNLKVDCMINSAGFGKIGPSLSYNWDDIIDIHIKGLLHSIKVGINQMKENKTGTIIEIGSIVGINGRSTSTLYSASKCATHAIIENMREEFAPYNVRLTFIAPGMTDTPIFDDIGSTDEINQNYKKIKEKMGGFLPPEKIAEAALFIYQQPQSVCIRDIVFASTKQAKP